MAAPAIPCDSCGSPIPDSDLEVGAAITLLGKRYCGACKTEAIQSVSLDDLADKPAPKAAPRAQPAPPTRAPAPKAPPPRPAPAPVEAPPPPKSAALRPAAAPEPAPPSSRLDRKASLKRALPAPGAASKKPLLIGIAAGAGIVVVLLLVLIFRGKTATPPAGPGTSKLPPAGTASSPASQPDRDTLAREAFTKVLELTQRAGVSGDLILAAAEKARPACRGTEWEKRLEEIRSKTAREKELEDAARELTPLFDELKGAVATDPEFKRFAELQPKFQLALEMAGKTASSRMPEIRALQKDYNGRYERMAEPYYNEINEAAIALSDERRYDDALKRIDSFPAHLKQSGAWLSLEQLRKDIERKKKQLPAKK